MNEVLLGNVMAGIDPARDLTDETLEDLVPHEQLMSKITAGIAGAVPESRTVRTPVWRRVPALTAASAAAVAIAVAGAVALVGSAPVAIQGTGYRALKSLHKTATQGPVKTPTSVPLTPRGAVVGAGVFHNRWVSALRLDSGVLTISPAPTSMKTPANGRAIAQQIWATSQLQGYSKGSTVSIGFGVVTITKHVAGVPEVKQVAAWVGLAHETAPYHCPMKPGGKPSQRLTSQAPSNGLAAVVVGEHFSPAVVYIAKSVRCGRLYPAELSNATEKLSLPWTVTGRAGASKIAIEVTPPPCGNLAGDAVAAAWRSGSLSSVRFTEYGTVPEYTVTWQSCPRPAPVRKVVDLRGPTAPTTRFVHPKTGPVTVVADSNK